MRSRQPTSGSPGCKEVGKKHGEAHVADILKRWLRDNKATARLDPGAGFTLWKEVVGEEIGERTRVVEIKNGEMIVEVDSAPLLNELSTYYCEEILESLRQREEFRGVHKLRFRAGSF